MISDSRNDTNVRMSQVTAADLQPDFDTARARLRMKHILIATWIPVESLEDTVARAGGRPITTDQGAATIP